MAAPDRRTILKSGAVAAAGALGIARATPAGASPLGAGIPFDLSGRDFRLIGPDGPGAPIAVGQSASGSGELLDASGAVVGQFHSNAFAVREGDEAASLIEEHTFVFSDGMVIGSGKRASLADPGGVYAFVGGTGRYAALQGGYRAEVDYVELGGDGSARFGMTTSV